jgi:hypothetical protein
MTISSGTFRSGLGGIALALVALGCSALHHDSGSNDGTGPSSGGSITAVVSQPNATIQQAGSDTMTVTVSRGGGYTGPVTVTVFNGGQGGITSSIDNIATAANVTTARLIITIGPSFPTGATGVTVAVQPDGGVTPVNVQVSINVTAKPGVFVVTAPTLSVGQGSSSSIPVTIRRTNYSVQVPMNLSTTQAGLTATFSPNPVTDSTTTMTLLADASVPLGTYSVGVRANEGITGFQATAPLTLTVTQPGSIAMTLNTNPLSIRVGNSLSTGATIVRTNFSGLITLAVTGMPSGITVVIANNPLTTITPASMTFSVASYVLAGSYPVTITASGPGISTVSAILTLTINP